MYSLATGLSHQRTHTHTQTCTNALTLGRQAVTPKNICPDSGENPVTLKC